MVSLVIEEGLSFTGECINLQSHSFFQFEGKTKSESS